MNNLFRLDGKVALVSGGTSGLGFAIAECLVAQGARVVVSSEDATAVEDAAQRLGDEAVGLTCDVVDEAACASLVAGTLNWGGKLDILVCAAGITGPPGPTAGMALSDFDRVMAVNLRGMLALTSYAMEALERVSGNVVLIGSISASRGNRTINAYALAKAGVVQLARNLAVEWGPRGVRINSLSPGFIRAGISRTVLNDEAFMSRRMAMTPLRRPGEAEEVAGAAVFLASPAAGFVTGQNLIVDGGTLITDGS